MTITLIIITIVLLAIFWFVSKIRKGMVTHDGFFTQVKFIQMYMADGTEKKFYGKSKEEAIEFGQDMLWSAAEDFHNRLHKAIIEKKPIQIGDMGLLLSAIKILKASEALVYINKHGPLNYEADEQPSAESTNSNSL